MLASLRRVKANEAIGSQLWTEEPHKDAAIEGAGYHLADHSEMNQPASQPVCLTLSFVAIHTHTYTHLHVYVYVYVCMLMFCIFGSR